MGLLGEVWAGRGIYFMCVSIYIKKQISILIKLCHVCSPSYRVSAEKRKGEGGGRGRGDGGERGKGDGFHTDTMYYASLVEACASVCFQYAWVQWPLMRQRCNTWLFFAQCWMFVLLRYLLNGRSRGN